MWLKKHSEDMKVGDALCSWIPRLSVDETAMSPRNLQIPPILEETPVVHLVGLEKPHLKIPMDSYRTLSSQNILEGEE